MPLLANGESEDPIGQAELSQVMDADTSPFSASCYKLTDNQTVNHNFNPDAVPDDCAEHSGERNNLNHQNGIAFVNIDSYEPDSSDGEEEGDQTDPSLAKEEPGVFQEALDSMLSELEKGMDSFSDLQSHLSYFNHNALSRSFEDLRPVPFKRHSSTDLDSDNPNKTLPKISNEEDTLVKNNLSTACDAEQQKNAADLTVRASVRICNDLSTNNVKMDQECSSELVVRPKVRKQNPVSQLDRKPSVMKEEEEKISSRRWSEDVAIQQHSAEYVLKHGKEKINSSMFFDPRDYEGGQKKTKSELRKQSISLQDNKSKGDDNAFWDEFEGCGKNLCGSNKDEDR